jgi:uncharacterized protein involved in exopolysaccharide biosynthesis
MDLRFYVSLFLRRLHWFLLVALVCSVLGIVVARVLPTVYVAEARLVVESEQIPDALAASTVQTQATEQLQIIQQRILTRDILVEMANRLDIYAARRAQGEPMPAAEAIVADLRTRIRIAVSGASPTQRRGETQATIVTVSFQAPTGALAAAVTNEVVTLILKEDVGMRTGVARQTLEFFEQEVARLDKELAQRAAAILAFKEENIAALPDSLDFRRSQQAAAQERLLQMERQEAELRDQRDRLVRLNGAARAANDLPPARDRSPEEQELQTLRDERARALAVLSPENPRVRVLDQQISALEAIVADQRAALAVDGSGEPVSAFDLQMIEIDGQLDYIADQRRQVQDEIAAITATIEATPGNAIALQALERDYAAVQDQYNQAVAARAKAATGDTIEALSKGQRISVIEQAVAPRAPASPNRPLVAAAGVGAGVFLGLALVALIELLKPGIRRPVDLVKGLGITPFATLPYLRTRTEVVRRRLVIWGGLLTVLAGLAGGLWAVHTFYMPLDLLLQQIERRFG